MSERFTNLSFGPPPPTHPIPRLRSALEKHTARELVDAIVEMATHNRDVFRQLDARFELNAPLEELVAIIELAIMDATTIDERRINYNFPYDYEAYATVERNLQRLINAGHLGKAMQLALELMGKGSYQTSMSDEGEMIEDIEPGVRVVMSAVNNANLPDAEVRRWCEEMIRKDHTGCICYKELEAMLANTKSS